MWKMFPLLTGKATVINKSELDELRRRSAQLEVAQTRADSFRESLARSEERRLTRFFTLSEDRQKPILEELMKMMTLNVFDGVEKPTETFATMDENEKHAYKIEVRDIGKSHAYRNEVQRLMNIAGRTITRKAALDVERAWHRGGMHYLETLTKRFDLIASASTKAPVTSDLREDNEEEVE